MLRNSKRVNSALFLCLLFWCRVVRLASVGPLPYSSFSSPKVLFQCNERVRKYGVLSSSNGKWLRGHVVDEVLRLLGEEMGFWRICKGSSRKKKIRGQSYPQTGRVLTWMASYSYFRGLQWSPHPERAELHIPKQTMDHDIIGWASCVTWPGWLSKVTYPLNIFFAFSE